MKNRLNNELANDLGNLLSRALTMTEKYFDGRIPKGKNELKFDIKKIEKLMDNYELNVALAEIWRFVNNINKYLNLKKPWESERDRENVIYTALDSLRIVGILLYPFIPSTIEELNKQLNVKLGNIKEAKVNLLKSGIRVKKRKNLFQKIE